MTTWIAGKVLHSILNMEDISDIDYRHVKRVF